jgi:O-antigen ligase
MTFKVSNIWKKIFWGICFVIIAYGLYATLNRAAWVGLSLGLIVFAVSSAKRWWIVVLMGAVAAAILILPDLRMRFESIFSEDYAWRDSIYGRSFRWGTALNIFSRYPIFGIGAGGFGGAVAYGIQAFGGLYVDNNYLLILSNYGLAGIVAFAFILISSIREAFKGLKAALEKDRFLIAGLIGGMVAFIVHLMFENLWDITPLNITFWIACGVCAGFATQKKESS